MLTDVDEIWWKLYIMLFPSRTGVVVCLLLVNRNDSAKRHILGCGDPGVEPMTPKVSKDPNGILATPHAN